jgi:hypothetical protein
MVVPQDSRSELRNHEPNGWTDPDTWFSGVR